MDVVTWLRTPGKLATAGNPEAAAAPAPPDRAAAVVPRGETAAPGPLDRAAPLAAPGSAAAPAPPGLVDAGETAAPAPPALAAPRQADTAPPHAARLADADRLEVAIRRARGAIRRTTRGITGGRLGGAQTSSELDALSREPRASRRSSPTLLAEGEAIWTAPYVRRGAVLDP